MTYKLFMQRCLTCSFGNVNELYSELLLHTTERLSLKRWKGTGSGKDVERREPSYVAAGIVKWRSHWQNTAAAPPDVRRMATVGPDDSTSGCILQRDENTSTQKRLCECS